MTTPSDQVRGPQDLVAYMNEATSEDWDKIPFPAKQQLGFHDRLGDALSGNGINEYTGKGPEELVGSLEQSEVTDSTQKLSSYVDYHLESTAPPAEPAGAPGSDGYNRLNRMVPPAKGFESEADATVTQTTGGRVVQFAPDQGLSEEEQAKVDGVGPNAPSPVAIQAGNADERTPKEELSRYGTANGVTHGDATSFNPEGNAPEKANEKTGNVGTSAAGNVAPESGVSTPAAPPAAAPAAAPAEGDDEIPSGSIDKVLAWVGDDKDRARKALDAEQGKSEPRQSLIAKLNERI